MRPLTRVSDEVEYTDKNKWPECSLNLEYSVQLGPDSDAQSQLVQEPGQVRTCLNKRVEQIIMYTDGI